MSDKKRRKSGKIVTPTPLWTGSEWTQDMLHRIYAECEKIGVGEMGLSIYPNRLEIISAEQMLDAYTSVGMPVMYNHWSYGKAFSRESELYKSGKRGLAYELVINSNPCINYLMEGNSSTMQALVIAHAAFGHNFFFKNNQMFKTWTDADSIIDYLVFARDYVAKCEERYGVAEVETFLDSAHALGSYGIDRYKRPAKISMIKEKERQREREEYLQSRVSDLYRLDPPTEEKKPIADEKWPKEPEENILYFIEKNSPEMKPWQREIIRIVRKISQYFYPQMQTKLGNEGFATYTHYRIMNTLHSRGLMTDGAKLEFLHSHTNVVSQPTFTDPRYNGINPYALGFEILSDIERICTNPTEEDRRLFPGIIGHDPLDVIKDAVVNFRDESLIRQYLSPTVIRKWGMFSIKNQSSKSFYEVTNIHNQRGYINIRETLADSYEWHANNPQIEVNSVNKQTRRLTLVHTPYKGRSLSNTDEVLKHLRKLWGYPVEIRDTNNWKISECV